MASRTKKWTYTVTYQFDALNLDKAIKVANDIDHRASKAHAEKMGEARLKESDHA